MITATGGLLATLLWLGRTPANPLMHTLLRPALLALMSFLLLLMAAGEPIRWPFALVACASLIGLWEGYGGVYRLLGSAMPPMSPTQQVRVCALWLLNTLGNLMLLNAAVQLGYPGTFQWRNEAASLLDIAYFTLLTFASGGYGDVLPATPLGKGLAMLTSLGGLTYATILFAALFHQLRAE